MLKGANRRLFSHYKKPLSELKFKISDRDREIHQQAQKATYREVAEKHGISRQRVEQIVRKFAAANPEDFHKRKTQFGSARKRNYL